MLWPKKNSYKEFDNEKKFLRLENSSPTHNFCNGPSLRPSENLSGGGGAAGGVQKKYSRKGKLNEKILTRQLILKNIQAMT